MIYSNYKVVVLVWAILITRARIITKKTFFSLDQYEIVILFIKLHSNKNNQYRVIPVLQHLVKQHTE